MILSKIDLTRYRSILCLNGLLPEVSFFTRLNLPVIAADGAANRLLELGIMPELIIGDMDSFTPTAPNLHKILHLPDQNSCDFQKSMGYLKDNGLLPAIVVGINGGHLDHVLNNINIFLETDCILYAPPLIGYVLKKSANHQVELPHNTKISLMGIPKATLSSKGLKWELNQTNLEFPGRSSCFNRTESDIVELNIHEGTVLVLFYEEATLDAGTNVHGPRNPVVKPREFE